MDIVIVGIDLGKNSCSVAGLDASGRVVLRRRMRRNVLENFVQGLQRCIVAMEACCGAHHLGRVFVAQGHEVRLMSPEYVRPYVKAQKNDNLDAEAIAEAASRPTMRFVEVKSQAQSDIQALHRARERLVSERTALINHLRALLLERGIVAAQGRRKLQEALSTFANEGGIEALSPRIRVLIDDLRSEWRGLDERIAAFDAEFIERRSRLPPKLESTARPARLRRRGPIVPVRGGGRRRSGPAPPCRLSRKRYQRRRHRNTPAGRECLRGECARRRGAQEKCAGIHPQ